MPTPDFEAIRTRYFLQEADAEPPTQPMPSTFDSCRITCLLDGERYFQEVLALLDGPTALVGTGTAAENARHFILIAGWWVDLLGAGVDRPFYLAGDPLREPGVPPEQRKRLAEILKAHAQRGVDVRVLAYMNRYVMEFMSESRIRRGREALEGLFRFHYETHIRTLTDLRTGGVLACLNTLGHTASGAHTKLVVVGTDTKAVGFTGSMDFRYDRYDDPTHQKWKLDPDYRDHPDAPKYGRHEVAAKVEGPAVQPLYSFFRRMWNELVAGRPRTLVVNTDGTRFFGVVPDYPTLPERALPTDPVGSHHVQSLLTLPAANYAKVSFAPAAPALSFSPPDGLFTVRAAWRKAILAAEQYIYMEDWAFWGAEIMGWIRESLVTHPLLKVVLVTGLPDPNDDPSVPLSAFLLEALYQGLVNGATPAEAQRVAEAVRVFKRQNVHVHSKTTLIDDRWAIVGSACCYRRSLYTDIEHAISFIDEDGVLVKGYRVALWGTHFDLAEADWPTLDNPTQALCVWEPTWGAPPPGVARPEGRFDHVGMPTESQLDRKWRTRYDTFMDVDSRDPWGIGIYEILSWRD